MRFFEDFTVGDTFDLGSREVSREEIVRFGREFDPQPFHVDEDAAADTPFGGLIASGWHTAGIYMRMYVDAILSQSASLGSPGVEELRWLAPVRPGDVLSGRMEVLDARPSEKDPRRGTLVVASEVVNQDDVVVLRFRARGLFARRPDPAPAG